MSALSRKKSRFSGKKSGKAGEIGAPGVDFGLREVGVDGERAEQVRRDPLGHVEAGMEDPLDVGRGAVAPAGGEGGPDGEADAGLECGKILEQAGATGLAQLPVPSRARPA
jgi:hypothetical protein